MIDKYAIVPIAAGVFALLMSPLLIYFFPFDLQAWRSGTDARPPGEQNFLACQKLFTWPTFASGQHSTFAQ
jgi:hypothetical protein